MARLALILHLFIGSTAAGSAIVLALTLGYDTAIFIVIAALSGFILATPISYFVAKALVGEN